MAGLKILEGIKVVSFTQHLLGPSGTQVLADMGADVIKVEAPKGAAERNHAGLEAFKNGVSLYQIATGRNYRDIVLDLKKEAAREAAFRLVTQADVVIENFRPGVMEKLGLGYEAVKAVQPDIIYVSCTGYGDDPAVRDLPGQDLIMQAMTGLADCCGSMDGPPTGIGAAVVDVHGGTLLAVGVVSALYHRLRTGEGQKISITMAQAAMDLQLEGMTYSMNDVPIRRAKYGMADGYSKTPYGLFATSDGYIALSISPIADYYEATGHDKRLEPYLDPHAAWEFRGEIQQAFTEIMKEKSTEEWALQLRKYGIWMQVVNSEVECLENPIIKAVHATVETEHPRAGKLKLLKHPVNYGCGEMEIRYLAPELGEHTAEILRELGYDQPAIERMESEKAIMTRRE